MMKHIMNITKYQNKLKTRNRNHNTYTHSIAFISISFSISFAIFLQFCFLLLCSVMIGSIILIGGETVINSRLLLFLLLFTFLSYSFLLSSIRLLVPSFLLLFIFPPSRPVLTFLCLSTLFVLRLVLFETLRMRYLRYLMRYPEIS